MIVLRCRRHSTEDSRRHSTVGSRHHSTPKQERLQIIFLKSNTLCLVSNLSLISIGDYIAWALNAYN